MLTSTRRAIQYPNPTRADVPDIPAHFVNLINALDLDTPFYTGTEAAKPAANTRVQGSWYWATDSTTLYFNDGSTWRARAPLASPAFTGTPTAPTPAVTDNSTTLATTAFVRSILPPGVIMAYVAAAAPSGWLICDGSAVSRSGANAALFAIIGTVYGAGDGSTTFNLPDLRGRTPVGKDTGTFATLGATGGAQTHSITIGELPAHTHANTATFSGNALGGHSHTFTGNVVPDHHHGLTSNHAPTSGDVRARFDVNAGSGGSTFVIDIGGLTGATAGTSMPCWTGMVDYTDSSAGNVSGSINSVSAGTPSGTVNMTNASVGSGTAMSLLSPYQVVNYIIKL